MYKFWQKESSNTKRLRDWDLPLTDSLTQLVESEGGVRLCHVLQVLLNSNQPKLAYGSDKLKIRFGLKKIELFLVTLVKTERTRAKELVQRMWPLPQN